MVKMSKDKRLETGKLCYDFAKLTFAAMVVGIGSAFLNKDVDMERAACVGIIGVFLTSVFVYIGYKLLK